MCQVHCTYVCFTILHSTLDRTKFSLWILVIRACVEQRTAEHCGARSSECTARRVRAIVMLKAHKTEKFATMSELNFKIEVPSVPQWNTRVLFYVKNFENISDAVKGILQIQIRCGTNFYIYIITCVALMTFYISVKISLSVIIVTGIDCNLHQNKLFDFKTFFCSSVALLLWTLCGLPVH